MKTLEELKKGYYDKFYKTWVVGEVNADNLNELREQWQFIEEAIKEERRAGFEQGVSVGSREAIKILVEEGYSIIKE